MLTFQTFDPFKINWQGEAIRQIWKEFDYTKGVHEVTLSGSVGCLKEDSLVTTIYGEVPICDITQQDHVLSFSHKQDQFVFQQGSESFPKDKGCLYRVIHEYGEFEASGNHLCATYQGTYLPVENLSCQDVLLSSSLGQPEKHHGERQRSSLSNVLRSTNTILSLIYDCAERIRQYDRRPRPFLDSALEVFPFRADAQEFGLFSYFRKPLHLDDFRALKLRRDHSAELFYPRPMMDFLAQLRHPLRDGEHQENLSKHLISSSLSIRSSLLSPKLNEFHLHILEQFLFSVAISIENLLTYNQLIQPVKSNILSIEKGKSEWYWDLQVPNSNNYYANGCIHHNSAKSIFMTHNIVRHVVEFPKATALIGRLARPDLKQTLAADISDHLEGDFIEGYDYEFNQTDLKWEFRNGSSIISRTWHDKKFKKFRSLKLSAVGIEELTENVGEHWDFYDAVYQRLGRLPHVPMNLMICATNPDSPAHPAYKKLILGADTDPLKHVFYSITTDNPFLPDWYVNNLMENMTPIDVERLIHGRWVEDPAGGIYWNYNRAINYRDQSYIFDLNYPIDLMHDFNIGNGKPMSAAVGQYIDGIFHIAKTYIVEGADTHEIMEEVAQDGIFEKGTFFRVYGDASGKNKDPRSKTTDYEIIRRVIASYKRADGSKPYFEMHFPPANPPIRKRHNRINARFKNVSGAVRFFIYKDAADADDGFRMTKLKKGGSYLEDDSYRNQHVTTAIGYWVARITDIEERGRSKFKQL